MPKKSPNYRHHKASGQGYTEYGGKSYYFGPYNSPESLKKFSRFLDELATVRESAAAAVIPGGSPLVVELTDAFLSYAQRRYVKDGKPTTEAGLFRTALAPVIHHYGETYAAKFGPIALETIRDKWIKQGLARTTINKYTRLVVRCWKWGVSKQIIPATTWQALTSLEPLLPGQGVDYPKVTSIDESRIAPLQPFVSRQVWAMIQFQLWTACRPTEACQLTLADIDKSHSIWEYRPKRFKTQHHANAERIIFIGPHAQKIVEEWAKDDPTELLWQPREARQEWLEEHGSDKPGIGPRQPGYRYTASSYCGAIERGCERAFKCPAELQRSYKPKKDDDRTKIKADAAAWRKQNCWSPNQLRHAAATRIRKTYGIEVARIILGHSTAFTTEIYAEEDREKARRAVHDSG